MRLLSKSTTRWQLLRLAGVWGVTLLCLYCITVGTNFREALVDGRLTKEVTKRNLSSLGYDTIERSDLESDAATPPSSFEPKPTPATPDSDPFDPPEAASIVGVQSASSPSSSPLLSSSSSHPASSVPAAAAATSAIGQKYLSHLLFASEGSEQRAHDPAATEISDTHLLFSESDEDNNEDTDEDDKEDTSNGENISHADKEDGDDDEEEEEEEKGGDVQRSNEDDGDGEEAEKDEKGEEKVEKAAQLNEKDNYKNDDDEEEDRDKDDDEEDNKEKRSGGDKTENEKDEDEEVDVEEKKNEDKEKRDKPDTDASSSARESQSHSSDLERAPADSVQRQNDVVMRNWLTEHIHINGTRNWWEHRFPVWKLDLDPDVMGPYKTPNWPWVTLEVGRYDPKLFTHPPGELPRQRLPHVIIFGAGKCGTRALIEFLKMHPNIASARAEVHYFDEHLDKGSEWYRQRMPLSYSNQVTLEKSPSYLWEPRAPRELYKINRDVKLILLVKDPVVRIMSQAARMDDAEHRHELLFLGERGGQKVVKNDSNTVTAGLYVEHLKNWLDVFPIDQMLVMEGMELIRQPYREIKKVEEFLQLPNVLRESNFYFNQTRGFYCPHPFYSREPECLSSAKGVPHPKLSPEAQTLIYDFYRPYNEKLFEIIGKRFDWEPKEQ